MEEKIRIRIRKPGSAESRTYWFRFAASLIIAVAVGTGVPAFLKTRPPEGTSTLVRLSAEDTRYLQDLYRDTWNSLAAFVDEKTGLPYDSSAMQPITSTSNAGFYLASVAAAYRSGLIQEDEAVRRVRRCLAGLEQVPKWKGIPRPWINVRTLKPAFGDEFHYGPHLANLLAGLTLVKTTFPGLTVEVQNLLKVMDFKYFYDPATGWLKGGYNVRTDNFAVSQPWGYWYYKFFAADTRLLAFFLIARRAAPVNLWHALLRPVQTREGETFFVSGYEEGGLSDQFLPGIFLDERRTAMGASQRSYARYQRKHARRIGAPVWGWSAAESPKGRYLTFGLLRDDIVAPYALALAVIHDPAEVVRNLRQLEKEGARPSASGRPGAVRFGFRDSFNWETKEPARHYLTLNQAMMFLSLANFLHDGLVWKAFREDPLVAKGFNLLGKDFES